MDGATLAMMNMTGHASLPSRLDDENVLVQDAYKGKPDYAR